MKIKTKPLIHLLLIFILGAFIGVVVDRTVIEKQMRKRFVKFEDPEFMKRVMFRIVQPTEKQREQIDSIMDKYSVRLNKLRFTMRQEATTMIDSLKNELSPVLTDEQKQRMEEHQKKMMQGSKFGFPFPKPGAPFPRDGFDPQLRPQPPDSSFHPDPHQGQQPRPDRRMPHKN
ncbi:MAG: hypothetical protein ACOY90_20225 [Candidatus Zhuqueibacterota bacterium]